MFKPLLLRNDREFGWRTGAHFPRRLLSLWQQVAVVLGDTALRRIPNLCSCIFCVPLYGSWGSGRHVGGYQVPATSCLGCGCRTCTCRGVHCPGVNCAAFIGATLVARCLKGCFFSIKFQEKPCLPTHGPSARVPGVEAFGDTLPLV